MRRWQNVAAVCGFLVVLAFAAERFSQVRTSSADLHELAPDLIRMGLFVALNAAIFLAIFWGAILFWKRVRGKPPRNAPAQSRPSTVGRLAAGIGVLSVVLAIAAESLTGMRTPGTLTLRLIFPVSASNHNLAAFMMILLFVMPILVDAGIGFAILWGGYLLWGRGRREEQPAPRSG